MSDSPLQRAMREELAARESQAEWERSVEAVARARRGTVTAATHEFITRARGLGLAPELVTIRDSDGREHAVECWAVRGDFRPSQGWSRGGYEWIFVQSDGTLLDGAGRETPEDTQAVRLLARYLLGGHAEQLADRKQRQDVEDEVRNAHRQARSRARAWGVAAVGCGASALIATAAFATTLGASASGGQAVAFVGVWSVAASVGVHVSLYRAREIRHPAEAAHSPISAAQVVLTAVLLFLGAFLLAAWIA